MLKVGKDRRKNVERVNLRGPGHLQLAGMGAYVYHALGNPRMCEAREDKTLVTVLVFAKGSCCLPGNQMRFPSSPHFVFFDYRSACNTLSTTLVLECQGAQC